MSEEQEEYQLIESVDFASISTTDDTKNNTDMVSFQFTARKIAPIKLPILENEETIPSFNYSETKIPDSFTDINDLIRNGRYKNWPVSTEYPKERFLDYLNTEINNVKESLIKFPMMLKNEKEIRLHALEQIKENFIEIFKDK